MAQKIDRNALKSAIFSTLTTLGVEVKATLTPEEKATRDASRKAAREARFAKTVEQVRTASHTTKDGRTVKLNARHRLDKALVLVKNGIELPSEFIKSAEWANASEQLKVISKLFGIEEQTMLKAFGIKDATETAPVATVVANVEGMQVIQHASAPKGKGKGKKAA